MRIHRLTLTPNLLGPRLRSIDRLQAISALLSTLILLLAVGVSAQSREPYPNAMTDRSIHPKTPMAPPPGKYAFHRS